jgi:ferric-dicitrate binding protein FerR (iron transport regulator)
MTLDHRQAYEAWQQADQAARSAEQRMKDAWIDHEQRRGTLPTTELMAEVSRLRSMANDKLTLAMVAMGSAAKPKGGGPGSRK